MVVFIGGITPLDPTHLAFDPRHHEYRRPNKYGHVEWSWCRWRVVVVVVVVVAAAAAAGMAVQ